MVGVPQPRIPNTLESLALVTVHGGSFPSIFCLHTHLHECAPRPRAFNSLSFYSLLLSLQAN